MAKYTLLQLVQQALSAIDAMNVQDINDTEESEQVVLIANRLYNELLDDFPWDHLRSIGVLEVTATANQMRLPSVVSSIDWIRYNGKDVIYKTPYELVKLLDSRDKTLTYVDSVGAYSNRDPQYWSSYDDNTVIFDAYNGSLVSALSSCSFVSQPSTLDTNTDIPDLPEILQGVLMNRVLADAFTMLKGDPQTGQVYESRALKQLMKSKRWARRYSEKRSTYNNGYGWNARRFTRNNEIPSSMINEA